MVMIATRIPDVGLCYVQVDDATLTIEDAFKFGAELTAAARRAQVLNSVRLALANGEHHDLHAVRELLQSVLSNLGNLR